MKTETIIALSNQLKEIARGLSFLGHPRYPLRELYLLFPQHKNFIDCLEDSSTPFEVDIKEKRKAMDLFLRDLSIAEVPRAVKKIFTQRINDYDTLLSMMESFNTPLFYEHCKKLYGTSHKLIKNNSFLYFIEEIPKHCTEDLSQTKLKGELAQNYLREKLSETFSPDDFEVRPSSSLLSDASAGRRTVKLNPFKTYTTGHLDLLLVHEGWVHLGTSLNGAAQVENPWLSTWSPRTTFLQEGLAIIAELITGTMTLERWNKVVLRHLATNMAERGSSITDVYGYLQSHGMEDLDAFKLALRIFRGVPLSGGMAFTKELLYIHGMIEVLYHLQFFKTDLRSLWIGKMSFEEHIVILDHWNEFNLKLKYFPAGLESAEINERLQKLKDLSFSLFNRGFLLAPDSE